MAIMTLQCVTVVPVEKVYDKKDSLQQVYMMKMTSQV
jgi:hypothetical protein